MNETIKELVVKSAPAPTPMDAICGFVIRMRPATAPETIRARVYEAVSAGKMLKIDHGVYIAIDGPAAMVVVQGDAWEALERLDADSIDLIATDSPYDLGTKQHTGWGTTRPPSQGRDYEIRDVDERWLRGAFRALKKNHNWRNLNTGQPRPGGGACIIFTPNLTRSTRKHVQALLDLAETIGFVYQGSVVWNRETMGMGYAFGRNQHTLLHLITAGDRGGVGWDLAMRDVLTIKTVRNPTGGEEHEAEKPVELFMSLIRFCTQPGDVCMDPFAGRARWAKQAIKEGRHVILVEKEEKWVKRIAVEDGGIVDA